MSRPILFICSRGLYVLLGAHAVMLFDPTLFPFISPTHILASGFFVLSLLSIQTIYRLMIIRDHLLIDQWEAHLDADSNSSKATMELQPGHGQAVPYWHDTRPQVTVIINATQLHPGYLAELLGQQQRLAHRSHDTMMRPGTALPIPAYSAAPSRM